MSGIGIDARSIAQEPLGIYHEILHEFSLKRLDLTLFGPLHPLANFEAKKVLFETPIETVKEQFTFSKLLAVHDLDLLHVPHWNLPLSCKKPLTLTISDWSALADPQSIKRYVYARTLFAFAATKARKIFVPSQAAQNALLQFLKIDEKKLQVIVPGAGRSFAQFGLGQNAQVHHVSPCQQDDMKEASKHSNTQIFLSVADLNNLSMTEMLIRAFLKIKDDFPQARLMFLGQHSNDYFAQRFKNHFEIQFLGQISKTRLSQIYKDCHLFIDSSKGFSWNYLLTESMSLGIPVCGLNQNNFADIAYQAGPIFKTGQEKDLAQHMQSLLGDTFARQTWSQKSQDRVSNFSWQFCAQKMMEVWSELV